jgi:hypothetical protein
MTVAMLLRNFQLVAPSSSREVNLRLSLASEVVVHWLRRKRTASASFAKLVVSVHEQQPPGDRWIVWPGGIGELKVADSALPDRWEDGRDDRWASDLIELGLRHAVSVGATIDLGAFAADVKPALVAGAPYAVELEQLRFRDRSTGRTYRVVFRFAPSLAEVVITGASGEVVLGRSEEFLDTGAIFPATRIRVEPDLIRFLARDGSDVASISPAELPA